MAGDKDVKVSVDIPISTDAQRAVQDIERLIDSVKKLGQAATQAGKINLGQPQTGTGTSPSSPAGSAKIPATRYGDAGQHERTSDKDRITARDSQKYWREQTRIQEQEKKIQQQKQDQLRQDDQERTERRRNLLNSRRGIQEGVQVGTNIGDFVGHGNLGSNFGRLGGTVGGIAGGLLGPIGGTVGGAIGGIVGGAVERAIGMASSFANMNHRMLGGMSNTAMEMASGNWEGALASTVGGVGDFIGGFNPMGIPIGSVLSLPIKLQETLMRMSHGFYNQYKGMVMPFRDTEAAWGGGALDNAMTMRAPYGMLAGEYGQIQQAASMTVGSSRAKYWTPQMAMYKRAWNIDPAQIGQTAQTYEMYTQGQQLPLEDILKRGMKLGFHEALGMNFVQMITEGYKRAIGEGYDVGPGKYMQEITRLMSTPGGYFAGEHAFRDDASIRAANQGSHKLETPGQIAMFRAIRSKYKTSNIAEITKIMQSMSPIETMQTIQEYLDLSMGGLDNIGGGIGEYIRWQASGEMNAALDNMTLAKFQSLDRAARENAFSEQAPYVTSVEGTQERFNRTMPSVNRDNVVGTEIEREGVAYDLGSQVVDIVQRDFQDSLELYDRLQTVAPDLEGVKEAVLNAITNDNAMEMYAAASKTLSGMMEASKGLMQGGVAFLSGVQQMIAGFGGWKEVGTALKNTMVDVTNFIGRTSEKLGIIDTWVDVDAHLGGMYDDSSLLELTGGEGRISQEFGGEHQGIDIAAESGSPVTAGVSGTVVRSDMRDAQGYGNLVVVEDEQGNKHYYGHLAERGVVVGDVVRQGQQIGTVGDTGRSTGPHLHYGIRTPSGQWKNPREYQRPVTNEYASRYYPTSDELLQESGYTDIPKNPRPSNLEGTAQEIAQAISKAEQWIAEATGFGLDRPIAGEQFIEDAEDLLEDARDDLDDAEMSEIHPIERVRMTAEIAALEDAIRRYKETYPAPSGWERAEDLFFTDVFDVNEGFELRDPSTPHSNALNRYDSYAASKIPVRRTEREQRAIEEEIDRRRKAQQPSGSSPRMPARRPGSSIANDIDQYNNVVPMSAHSSASIGSRNAYYFLDTAGGSKVPQMVNEGASVSVNNNTSIKYRARLEIEADTEQPDLIPSY